jgi:hypothetical protein
MNQNHLQGEAMQTKGLTLHEAREAYLKHLAKIGKKPATVVTYGKDFDLFESFLRADCTLQEITPADIGRFLKSDACLKLKSGKDRAKPTIDKTTRLVRMFLLWAKTTGRIKEAPLPADMPLGRDATKKVAKKKATKKKATKKKAAKKKVAKS